MRRLQTSVLAAASLAQLALAHIAGDRRVQQAAFSPSMYESGAVMHMIMQEKEAHWDKLAGQGRFAPGVFPTFNISTSLSCVDGVVEAIEEDAMNTFRCNNIDLYDFQPHSLLGSNQGRGSSSWGWTSDDGREFIAIGQVDGAAFAEITPEGKLVYLGRLPAYSTPSMWREIRGFKNYMIIGSEAAKHNVQIFDMTKLLDIDPQAPKKFSNEEDLTGLFKGLPQGKTHNIVVNEEANMAYAVGAQPRNGPCKAGIIFIDLSNPAAPTSPGCASGDNYVHDARCSIYRGPDVKFQGQEICVGFNERNIVVYDTTNKKDPKIISRTSYDGAAYTHQGWWIDDAKQEYLLVDDEYDERNHTGLAKDGRPTTYIWDVRSLEKPIQTGYFKSEVVGVDHNQYVYNGFTYQSNYGSGLRVVDVRSIPQDPTGNGVREVGFFDIYPEDDEEGGKTEFVGSWSSYAGFKSGYIYINSIERGGFVVKIRDVPQ